MVCGFVMQFGCDVLCHGVGLQVGLVGLLGHLLWFWIAVGVIGYVYVLQVVHVAVFVGGDEVVFGCRQCAVF